MKSWILMRTVSCGNSFMKKMYVISSYDNVHFWGAFKTQIIDSPSKTYWWCCGTYDHKRPYGLLLIESMFLNQHSISKTEGCEMFLQKFVFFPNDEQPIKNKFELATNFTDLIGAIYYTHIYVL